MQANQTVRADKVSEMRGARAGKLPSGRSEAISCLSRSDYFLIFNTTAPNGGIDNWID
ncbi:hypothetical protein GCM10028805_09420 [Spirosoma harenae]